MSIQAVAVLDQAEPFCKLLDLRSFIKILIFFFKENKMKHIKNILTNKNGVFINTKQGL